MAFKDAENNPLKLTEAKEVDGLAVVEGIERPLHSVDEIITSSLGGEPTTPACAPRLYMVGKTATDAAEQLKASDANVLEPLPDDELPHDAPGKKINPLGVTLKTSAGEKTDYSNAICALKRELDYITNPENIFEPQNYRKGNVNGVLIHDTPEQRIVRDISFHLFYVYGTAFLKGHTDNSCFRIFYNQSEGFNIDFAEDYKTLENDPPITRYHTAKDVDGAMATLLAHLAPTGEWS